MSNSMHAIMLDKPPLSLCQESFTGVYHPEELCLLDVCTTCQGQCCIGRTMITAKEREQIITYSSVDYFVHWKDDFYYLDKGVCPYLRNRLCSVQAVKPFVCQIFPFVPRVVEGEFWLYCVGECDAGFKLPPSFVEKAKALAQRFFAGLKPEDYADYWLKNKIGDFDDMRMVFKVKIYDDNDNNGE